MPSTEPLCFQKKAIALLVSTVLAGTANVYAAEEDESEDEDKGVPTVTVTARRTAENIQRVPVSVSVFSAEDIFEAGIDDLTEIQQFSPNVTFQTSRATNTTLTAFIRGIGQQDPLWGFEPGVGIYIDDVYIARPQGAIIDVLDLDRIEVLRGPQGTLYGKNTIGGAVKYVTREMTGDAEFGAQLNLGSFNQQDVRLTGQIPIVDDKLYLGIAHAELTRDGFGTFRNTGAENYNRDISTSRITMEYRPNDDWNFRLAYDTTEDTSNARGGYRLTPSIVNIGQVPYDDIFDSDSSLPTDNLVETGGLMFTAKYEINDEWTFKYIFGDREGDTVTNIDFDATAINSFDVPAIYDDEQRTNELQMTYSGDNMTAVFGAYHYEGLACGVFDVILGNFGITAENSGCVDTKSEALYGQASFNVTDKVSMTLGGRYTRDEKSANIFRGIFAGVKLPDQDGVLVAEQTNFGGAEDWSEFAPRIGVEYQANDNIMYYASYAEGFKSGGFDMRANVSVNPNATDPFDPETVETVELGFKADLLDNLWRINATLFFSDYTDQQVTVPRQIVATDFANQVLNAGSSTINGLEIESTAALTDDLTLIVGIGLIDAEYNELIAFDPITGQDQDFADLYGFTNTPETSINIGANYNFEGWNGEFSIAANYAFRGDTQIFEIPSALDEESYDLFNLGINWYHSGGQWRAGLHINNLFDEEYRVAGYNFPATFDGSGAVIAPGLGGEDTVTAFFGNPRTITLSIGYDFL